MFDRVVAALALVMLLLFSATVALACSECGRGTAQCSVSLEHRAEEALDANLDASFQSIVTKDVSDGEGVYDYGMICDVADVSDRNLETKAVGAVGVQHDVVINYNDAVQHGIVINKDHGIIGRDNGSGRFTGAAS